jgi:hypothetical protein
VSRGFRFGKTIEESCASIIRERTITDPRANARYAAHKIARELLREAKLDKSIARDMVVERKWFKEVIWFKYRVPNNLLIYTIKVALEQLQ